MGVEENNEAEGSDGMEWEDIEWQAGGASEGLDPKSRVFKRSFYVGRSTVGAARKARMAAGCNDKHPLTDPLLLDFQEYLKSTSTAPSNIANMVSDTLNIIF